MSQFTLSLSTCWNSARHPEGYPMLEEIAEMGFSYAELSHGIRMTLVPGILKAVEDGVIKISSTHNFCPLPSGVQHAAPNFYQPSSPNRGELRLWHTYTEKTFAFAKEVGARHVVAHSGSAFFFLGKPTGRLDELEAAVTEAETGNFTQLAENAAYGKALEKVQKKVHRKFRKTGPRVAGVFAQVLDAAIANDICICVENREGVLEFPPDDEIDLFIEAIAGEHPGRVRYWHDAGHAQIKHLMGALDHGTHLAKMAPLIAGFHLHDVNRDGRDHMRIGSGTQDWTLLRRFMQPEHRLILELSPRLSKQEILDSKAFLEDLL